MAEHTAWWEFIESIKGDMTTKALAHHLGVSVPTLSRWKRGAHPDPNLVIDVARVSNANIIGAMVAAGYLSPTEVDAYVHGQLALSDVPLTQLLREVADRIDHLEDQLSTDQDPAAAATQRGRSILNGLIG